MNELEQLIKSKNSLEEIPAKNRSLQFQNLYMHTCSLVFTKCNHNIIYDYIDIDVEKSQQICYCDICLLTINAEFICNFLLFNLDSELKEIWKLHVGDFSYPLKNIYTKNNTVKLSIISDNNNKISTFDFKPEDFIGCSVFQRVVILN